jgi:hypothetical protein
MAPRVPSSIIRRGIVVVLTMSGVALLDKAGWPPLGAEEDETYPMLIVAIGLALIVLMPIVWGFLRRGVGLPMFGTPTVAEIESDPRETAEHEQQQEHDRVQDRAESATGPPTTRA